MIFLFSLFLLFFFPFFCPSCVISLMFTLTRFYMFVPYYYQICVAKGRLTSGHITDVTQHLGIIRPPVSTCQIPTAAITGFMLDAIAWSIKIFLSGPEFL